MPIGTPRVGQVIRYSFLWSGREEKDRPAVVITAISHATDGKYRVAVMPITHRAPADPETSVEIPSGLKTHLKLDDERSWVIVDEINEFVWPGYDLRPISTGKWEYGQLPSGFYNQIVDQYAKIKQLQKVRTTRR